MGGGAGGGSMGGGSMGGGAGGWEHGGWGWEHGGWGWGLEHGGRDGGLGCCDTLNLWKLINTCPTCTTNTCI